MDTPDSVYIHIPFCRTRCFYCDFNTYAGKQALIPAYVSALCEEVRLQAAFAEKPVHTVYFGGGTPSQLPSDEVKRLMDTLRETFTILPGAEITFEANPCDVTPEMAENLVSLGVNRISLGMQSAVPEELKRMGRRHTAEQTAEAVQTLKQTGLDNISLDLIYGYPGQTPESWSLSLQTAVSLNIKHISLYALSVEEGSALNAQLKTGRLILPDDSMTADMYDLAADFLESRSFRHYEISNWAADPFHESRHNKQYWYVRPYYGFGAGAHGWINRQRIRNCSAIPDYIEKVRSVPGRFPASDEIIPQSRRIEMQDYMMLHLRLLEEGIAPEGFRERFGEDMETVFGRELRRLERRGLTKRTGDGRIRLSRSKVLVANQAFIEFVD